MSAPFRPGSVAPPAGIPVQAAPRGPEFVIPAPVPSRTSEAPGPAGLGTAPAWNTILAASTAVLAAVFTLASLFKAYLLDADADLLTTLMRDPAGVTNADVRALAAVEHRTDLPYLVLLYLTFMAFVAWIVLLNSHLKPAGRGTALWRLPAMRVWQAGLVASLATLWIARTPDSAYPLSGLVAADHRALACMLVRAVVGGLCVWVAVSLRRRTQPLLQS